MIDFQNAKYIKLHEDDGAYDKELASLLVQDEVVVGTYRAMRDGVVFTNKRIIVINVQGVTGKKKDFTSLPYAKIQAFSVETSGVFDLDSELILWFSGLGKVEFEFTGRCKIAQISRIIATYAL